MLGPKRVKLPDDAQPLAPPYELANNPHSLLDITDLVFIDPVSTGFSRPAKGEDKGQFHGYRGGPRKRRAVHSRVLEQVRPLAVAEVSHRRELRRAAGGGALGLSARAVQHRAQRDRDDLAGDQFQHDLVRLGNDLPYILFLPSYTATAWYHKALPGDLQALPLKEVYQQAVEFANSEYALALMKGNALSDAERNAVAEKLARLTGLSKEYVEGAKLRMPMWRFAQGAAAGAEPDDRPLRQPLHGHRRGRCRRERRSTIRASRRSSGRSRRRSTTTCATS